MLDNLCNLQPISIALAQPLVKVPGMLHTHQKRFLIWLPHSFSLHFLTSDFNNMEMGRFCSQQPFRCLLVLKCSIA